MLLPSAKYNAGREVKGDLGLNITEKTVILEETHDELIMVPLFSVPQCPRHLLVPLYMLSLLPGAVPASCPQSPILNPSFMT